MADSEKKHKDIYIPGDLNGDLNFGTGNVVNGQQLSNPTLPKNAIVDEGNNSQDLDDLGETIRREVAAKIAGTTDNTAPADRISIGGETRGTIIINKNNLNIDNQHSNSSSELPGTERTLPYKMGISISNGNVNGTKFEGTWVLKVDDNNQPIKQDGQFVYVKK